MKRSYVDFTFTETVEEIQSDFVTSCSNLCLTRPFCVAVIFTKSTSRCRLQKMSTAGIITMIETDSQFYEVQFERSDRKIYPATCSEVKKCSPTASDGEFWLYPSKFNRQIPVKSYCYNMFSPETAEEFISLQNTNYFIRKDFCHLENDVWCSRSSEPLRRTDFSKVKINITTMGVVQDDFTFATSTGVSNLPDHNVPFGTTNDCTAEAWWYKKYHLYSCSIAAKLQIDLRESGVVVANSVSWVPSGWATEILNFDRSSDSSQIYCLVIGWCGGCIPNSTIYLESMYEPASVNSAEVLTCQ